MLSEIMTELINQSWSLERRRELRKKMTRAEIIFWNGVRAGQFEIKFRRQVGIGPYIADFYSPKNRIVIELDGESHDDARAQVHDQERDAYMRSLGIHVIRFTNDEIMNNLDAVLLRARNTFPLLTKEGVRGR